MNTSQYLDIFLNESADHLEVLYKEILMLEKNPKEKSIIEEMFRAAHTLKSMAATMGYTHVTDLTHHLENIFDQIRYEKITVQPCMIDVLLQTVDNLKGMIENISNGGNDKKDVTEITAKLIMLNQQPDLIKVDPAKEEAAATISTMEELTYVQEIDAVELTSLKESKERGFSNYEIHIELSEDCLLKGARVFMVFSVLEELGEIIKSQPTIIELEEELFDHTFTVLHVSKQSTNAIEEKIRQISEVVKVEVLPFSVTNYRAKEKEEYVCEISGTNAYTEDNHRTETPATSKSIARKTIRVNVERLDALMNLFEEFNQERSRLETISSQLNHNGLQETAERMTRVSGDLQDIILHMRMVPIDQVFNRFPRMVRQLSRELNKIVKIDIFGGDTELDQTIIDKIGDPLVHLLRNAIDHGIENPETRTKQGKHEQGTITLKAYHSGNYVIIEVSDDGAGINKKDILAQAIEKGVINQDEALLLNDHEVYKLIMASGFSTARTVTNISGRGVGLDVVKNTIEMLGGQVSIIASLGNGTTFSIQLQG